MTNNFNSFDGPKGHRRQSSGTLVSPEIDMGTAGSTAEAEHDGFYLLKKDSQRRTTLARVLAHDHSTLCKVWLSFIYREFAQPMLTSEHLEVLMKGLRDYISDQNRAVVERAIFSLKEQMEFDSNTVHQLHFSLYFFQDAAKSVLRLHNIKPHWMFALDNLVHNAVQAAISVLKPELEDNFVAKESKPDGSIFSATTDDTKNSSPSFNSSVKSHKTDDSCFLEISPSMKSKHELHRRALMLQAENHRLLEEVLDCQKSYNSLLKKTLEDQKDQVSLLRSMIDQNVAVRSDYRYDYETFNYEHCADSEDLVEWLQKINIDEVSIKRIVYEQFRLDQILHDVSREDLRSLGLKRGVELRLWKEIEQNRLSMTDSSANLSTITPSLSNSSSEGLLSRRMSIINNNNHLNNSYMM